MALPACKDTLIAGLIVILAGNGEAPGGLCPPHPLAAHPKRMTPMIPSLERNLPMHSSLFCLGSTAFPGSTARNDQHPIQRRNARRFAASLLPARPEEEGAIQFIKVKTRSVEAGNRIGKFH
jgi:hypothetical protein